MIMKGQYFAKQASIVEAEGEQRQPEQAPEPAVSQPAPAEALVAGDAWQTSWNVGYKRNSAAHKTSDSSESVFLGTGQF
jgi:hypothetical protein